MEKKEIIIKEKRLIYGGQEHKRKNKLSVKDLKEHVVEELNGKEEK